jgi:hypothetical protein
MRLARGASQRELEMNGIGRISLGTVALLALSGIASARSSQPAVESAGPETVVAAPLAAAPSEIKPAKAAAKRNAPGTTETHPIRDPYAVPLFQQARSLK